MARERLEAAREAVKALCEPVALPRDSAAYLRYFCAADVGQRRAAQGQRAEPLALYKLVGGPRARLRQPRERAR